MSPNWCHDSLGITGPKDQIALFKEILVEYNKHTPLDDEHVQMCFAISAFFPTPLNIGEKWYAWRCANWGTKWDVSDPYIEEDEETSLMYSFDTAWGPPLAAIAVISTQFPKLLFSVEYSEPGMSFEGTFVVQDGHVKTNEEREMTTEVREGV
jgi:hypothetical protein